MKTPLFSIIIPVYNSKNTLNRCIESVINQSYSFFELLLIDDDSSDNSYNICLQYAEKDNRIICYHNISNLGVTITRNKGLDLAKGDFILFIDNDDYIDNYYLESFFTVLKDHLSIDLFTQNITFHYANIEPFIVSDQLSLGGPWGKLFKREIIETHNIRFIPHLQYNEDNLFLLDYLECIESIYNIPCAGYHYIIHENCTSKKLEKDYKALSTGLIIFIKRLKKDSLKNNYNLLFAKNRCCFIYHRYISALYSTPLKDVKKRKDNYISVVSASDHSYMYYPKQYKLDSLVVYLIKNKLFSLAFYINDLISFIRIINKKRTV